MGAGTFFESIPSRFFPEENNSPSSEPFLTHLDLNTTSDSKPSRKFQNKKNNSSHSRKKLSVGLVFVVEQNRLIN